MKRHEIKDKIETIWDECQKRNIGSNEAELDFIESVTDWIVERDNEPIVSKLLTGSVLLVGADRVDGLKALLGENKEILVTQPEDMDINRHEALEKLKLTIPEPITHSYDFDEPKHSPIYTPKRKKFKKRP